MICPSRHEQILEPGTPVMKRCRLNDGHPGYCRSYSGFTWCGLCKVERCTKHRAPVEETENA